MPKLLQKPRNKQTVRQDKKSRTNQLPLVLITGHSGFIGSKLNGKTYTGDMVDCTAIWEQAIDVKGIVHLAAKSNKYQCELDPGDCFNSNLIGVYNVLEVALQRKIWVLFISTYQVREKNLYGLTKLVGEELCRLYVNKGLKVKILRLPIVYGPGDKANKVVTKVINELESGIEPIIDTPQKFYFAYVDDVAKRIEKEVKILEGGWGKKHSLTDLVTGIRNCLDEKKK